MHSQEQIPQNNNGKGETEQKRTAIRDALIAWLPKAESGKEHLPTKYTPEEAQKYVDWIFRIEDDGSVTVKNLIMFMKTLESVKEAPPSLTMIDDSLSLSLINVHSLDWLRGVTINGDLYLPKGEQITTIPDGITIRGKIFAGNGVSKKLIHDVRGKYPEKFIVLDAVDRS
ncbi:hypothetical protein HY625_02270 [Candidatus Uhrbacteria bacterium]|nr:hypothetical protein [Candidatus Uhrbacteria bacterium]